jgi:hypothetical protein
VPGEDVGPAEEAGAAEDAADGGHDAARDARCRPPPIEVRDMPPYVEKK